MTLKPRYLFVLPDVRYPVGGCNVLLDIVETLYNAGYRAAPLFSSPHYRYPFSEISTDAFFHPPLGNAYKKGRLDLTLDFSGLPGIFRGHSHNKRLKRSPADVFILPEFAYPQYARLFSDAPCILAAQDVFSLSRAFVRDISSAAAPIHQRFHSVLTTSDASQAAVETLLNRESLRLTLPVVNSGLDYNPDKFLQIAYMPRKRSEESAIVTEVLRHCRALLNVPIVPIQNMSNEERNRVLRESLVFLSFSEQEGFGLPPAEAMATGSIVIGYTGVGGNEFFSSDFGFPIEDSDIVNFIQTVKTVVKEYQLDPGRLDKLRKDASDHIHAHYNLAASHSRLLEVWAGLDDSFRAI